MATTRQHSNRKAVIAGVGGLAATALGYRAWDRGVFAGAKGPAYTSWEEWHGTAVDGYRRPLRAALLAASPHNTQPWRFEESAAAITVYADRARHLGSFDPFRREMHLGLGCAIENFVLAARVFGIATDVDVAKGRLELSPGPHPVVAARIALGPAKPSSDPLFDSIPKRRTHRGPYRDKSIAPELLRQLADLVSARRSAWSFSPTMWPGARLAASSSKPPNGSLKIAICRWTASSGYALASGTSWRSATA